MNPTDFGLPNTRESYVIQQRKQRAEAVGFICFTVLLIIAAVFLCSCSLTGGYEKKLADGTEIKGYAQARLGTNTTGEKQSAAAYSASSTNQSEGLGAGTKAITTRTAINAFAPAATGLTGSVGTALENVSKP